MKYSIIIPTIGRKTLEEVLSALFSCEGIEDANVEVLVVFDGLMGVIPENLKRSSLRILHTGKKAFAAGARNLGIKKATGDIICFIGDDTIPEQNWFQEIVHFHKKHKSPNAVLLGHIAWVDEYADDPFYKFLENGPQFNFRQIIRNGATWKHFYTSNISLKQKLIEDVLFSEKFKGWGFEDIEFAYRLHQKGMRMHYEANCVVYHDDPQTLEQMIERTRNARKNACIFELMHPRVRIIPRRNKRMILLFLIFWAGVFSLFSKRIKWWYLWKKNWVG